MSRKALLNAFLPSSGIEDPHRFAGRHEEIEELTNALMTNGSIPLIYGQRGLGKSSVALQLSRIAQGDVELLSELELDDLALPEEDRFITFYVNCSDSTKGLKSILQLLINAVESLKHEKIREDARERLVDKTTRRTISLKVFKAETTKKYAAEIKALDTSSFTEEEKLVRLTETLTDVYGQKVLFVIDELDRAASTKGLASFLKSYSSDYLKFALVGIGTTEGDLLRDHASLSRQLVPVKLPPMTSQELESIAERAQDFLAENGENYEFSEPAKEQLARIASGFPWFVHLIGQAALIDASRSGITVIKRLHIDRVVTSLPKRRLARQFHEMYLRAVRDSSHREVVLRLFAEWKSEDVPTSFIYPRAKQLGVSGPSTYLGHLTQESCGYILAKSPQLARHYRFTDEMFKVYVRMRPSVYEGVGEEVKAAFHKK